MIRYPLALAVVAAAVCTLTACGSDSSGTSAAESRQAEISAATHPSSSSAPSGPTIDPAGVDVCGLLSAADANKVAHDEMLDDFQTPSTVYSFTATKQSASGGPACTFRIKAPAGEDGRGSVTFHVRSAKGFAVPPNGQPIAGLGTEAYDTGTSPVVRVGTVVISSDNNSFADSFTVALLRKMVPKLT